MTTIDHSPPALEDLTATALRAGLRRVHVLAWRDLADAEAGGSETHLDHVVRRWAAAGLEVTVRTSAAPGLPDTEERGGYRVIRRGGRYDVFPRAAAAEVSGRHGPADGLVEFWNGVPFLSPLWFRGPRITVLHHVHRKMWPMVLPEPLATGGRLLEGRLAPPFYRSTPVVTLCDSSRREIIELLGLPAANVHVALPGIDPWFSPAPHERSATPLVVAVGRLVPHKRFDALLSVVAELRPRHEGLQVVIAGEGGERPALEKQAAALGIQDCVRFAGRISDEELRSLYRRAWVLAATSVAEGFGMTITEAAACGTPAVATRVAGHADAVVEGRSGVLTSSRAEFADRLDAVLADADFRRRLSEGAASRAAELTWDATAAQVLRPLVARATAGGPSSR